MVKKFYIVSCAALVACLCLFPQDTFAADAPTPVIKKFKTEIDGQFLPLSKPTANKAKKAKKAKENAKKPALKSANPGR